MEKLGSNNNTLSLLKGTIPRIRSRKSEVKLYKSTVVFSGLGILGSALNIANTNIGGGTLELPYVMSIFGIVMSSLILLWVFFISLVSMTFLLRAKDYTGISDYKSLARLCFKSKGAILADASIFFCNFGICVGYFIIYANCLDRILAIWIEVDPDSFWQLR